MADPRGFLTYKRRTAARRPVELRVRDWSEIYEPFAAEELNHQAARCMNCGIPFCHTGCPLGNLIPEWNDLTFRERLADASHRLHATNSFPEFTGRLCPAPCETACVLGINDDPVAIERIELEIAEAAFAGRHVVPMRPLVRTGKRVAVVGSGPAGLAAAQQLNRAGHNVEVFERADRIGGLLRYGIPEFKLEKTILDRRLAQLEAEGIIFHVGVEVGVTLPAERLRSRFDAIVLATGATRSREFPVPGRELAGIHQAMEYLPLANRVCLGDLDETPISAAGKRVVIIGGGDTGADCLGTAHRQGAISVHQLEIMPRPPDTRAESTPWPMWPLQLRTGSAHEEGGERLFAVGTDRFIPSSDGRSVAGLAGRQVKSGRTPDGRPSFEPVEGSEFELPCDLVLLAMGFTGPETGTVVAELGLEVNSRGNVARDDNFATSVEGVFVCGDAGRGQSLIVWAIAEGRSAAAAADRYLMGSSALPAPIHPTQMAIA
jgi:glutamate synthase (NADPH/NADH) small chain